ncbi:uncharacterized protein THITE_2107337 [Thermothielavioides terrestris NRRL 8126]|jgi:hypothetical protein|uniref:Uncharacterized protein n=1 Tax=Thermothielavioides terrestris (strain ATCC 38088 / NRRL 8126) TaxID=578455 RepID=G2QTQ9_THETT|nr:uncharacterized protein THITE_2107337 [Thermothielavioides terrestris NRRL 8126]AEO62769.1 hypothetical protein THITE_2107337 [Thermothielavioides terrestris NRRL 8126]
MAEEERIEILQDGDYPGSRFLQFLLLLYGMHTPFSVLYIPSPIRRRPAAPFQTLVLSLLTHDLVERPAGSDSICASFG